MTAIYYLSDLGNIKSSVAGGHETAKQTENFQENKRNENCLPFLHIGLDFILRLLCASLCHQLFRHFWPEAPSDSDVSNSLDVFASILAFAHQCIFVCICCVFLFVFVVYQVWFSLTLCLVSCAAVINGGFFSSLHFPNTLPPEREGFPPRAGFICDICEMYFQRQIFHPLQWFFTYFGNITQGRDRKETFNRMFRHINFSDFIFCHSWMRFYRFFKLGHF